MPRRGEKKARQPVGDPTDPRGWAALIDAFLEWMRVTGYSERTVGNRADALDQLARWCVDRSLLRPAEITKPVLDRYRRHLFHYRKKNGKPLSFRSQHSRLVPVRAFFKWLTKNNHILSNPASELELPRLEKRLPRAVLTAGEAEQILAQPDASSLLGLRDRAILEVFYSTGMRRMELIGLDLYALDAERGTVMVRQGKGKRDRMIPIGERAVAWIGKYLDDVRPELATEPDAGAVPDARRPALHAQPADPARPRPRQRRRPAQEGRVSSVSSHDGDVDAGGRGRHPLNPGHAGPRRPVHDPDLHPGQHPQARRDPRRHAPRRAAGTAGRRRGPGGRGRAARSLTA